VAFVGVHVVTTVSDGYVPIGFADAFIPFRTAYRPLWVGLGALTFDLMLAVLVTSALRRRIGFSSWRFVHWLSYLCWPIAIVHGLGSGSDTSRSLVLFVDILCAAAVFAVVAWRLVTGRTFTVVQRAVATIGTVVIALVIVVFAVLGPLKPGWSRRAGTSNALLAQLAKKAAGSTTTTPAGSTTTTAPPRAGGSGSIPSVPFTVGISGTQSAANAGGGQVQVTLSMQLQNATATPLTVVLIGSAVDGGGVAMSSGSVTFGPDSGVVTALNGGTVDATVNTSPPIQLVLSLNVDQSTGALSGTVTGTTTRGSR
jgi:hypothetical protein